jgi:hypothetical protein
MHQVRLQVMIKLLLKVVLIHDGAT